MKIERHRSLHLLLEKVWDSKIGIVTAFAAVTVGYEFMEWRGIPLDWLGENTPRGWATKFVFTLWMTAVSIARGWLVGLAFIHKERHDCWWWQARKGRAE